MYQYTENNPISRADTLGIFWFAVAGIVLGGIVGVAINGVVNVAYGDNFFEGWLGAAAGGAFYGGIATTPLNFTLVGSAIMNYGSAFITETISGIENIFKGTYEFGDITTGTVINGSLGMVISNPINVGETWIRPTSTVTSFTGNYQQKLIANQVATSALSGFISKEINKLTKKLNEKFDKLIGKFSNGLGFGGGASSGAGFGGGGGDGRVF